MYWSPTVKRLAKWGLLALLLLLTGCPAENTSDDAADRPLRIGFIPSENASEIQQNAQPLVDRLSQSLGREVQSFVASDYTGVVEAFRNERLDVAFLTPASYVMAHNEAGVGVILRAQRGKTPHYYSVIFARADSKVSTLADLKGKTFAFGDSL
ncbi:MAG: phosphate ABC transporter substrate-binding protein, partial [Candidatus Melainabacteria bacterium HGW-Melainabacteria-1]